MARKKRGKRLRELAAPFTVAAPSGARIRDRVRVTGRDAEVLRLVGEHLGHHQRADLACRVGIGKVRVKDNQRTERKRELTKQSSSRMAGSMTRASEDQYQLSLRCLYDEASSLRRAIRAVTRRLAIPCGERKGKARGYKDQAERFEKQRRSQVLKARLARVEQRIQDGRPVSIHG